MPEVARGVREAAAAEISTTPEIGGGRSVSWSGELASSAAASGLGVGDDAQPKAARIARSPGRRELGDVEKCRKPDRKSTRLNSRALARVVDWTIRATVSSPL